MTFIFSYLKKVITLCIICFVFSVSHARDYYAAIFVDETTGIAGTAYDYFTQKEATLGALATCKKKSKKKYCVDVILFSNGCGAAAWSPKNKYVRGAIAETSIKAAENNALVKCRQSEKDPNCKIVASVCTNWETVESTLIWW